MSKFITTGLVNLSVSNVVDKVISLQIFLKFLTQKWYDLIPFNKQRRADPGFK